MKLQEGHFLGQWMIRLWYIKISDIIFFIFVRKGLTLTYHELY